VTAIEVGPCYVTQIRTTERDGYDAIQLGFGEAKRLNKAEKGHLKQLPANTFLKHLREIRLAGPADVAVGDKVEPTVFEPGDVVDVVGTSKGKGFAGVVKRHHFRGGPKTHGQSDRHRSPGSVGAGTTPGRVLKNVRMAGHMGDVRVTVQNLEIVKADPDRNLLLVKGSVPGANNGLVIVKQAVKAR
jgi:large subunit ribosomal protein L3